MTFKRWFDGLDFKEKDKYDSFDTMLLAWNTARRTDPVKKQMYEVICELTEIFEDVRTDDIDSFTLQPARIVKKTYEEES